MSTLWFIGAGNVYVNIIRNTDSNILSKNDLKVTETLLYGDSSYDDTNNTLIMKAMMEFLFASKRFDVPLIYVECDFIVNVLVKFIFS